MVVRFLLNKYNNDQKPKSKEPPRLHPLGLVSMPTRHGGELVAERSGQANKSKEPKYFFIFNFKNCLVLDSFNFSSYVKTVKNRLWGSKIKKRDQLYFLIVNPHPSLFHF